MLADTMETKAAKARICPTRRMTAKTLRDPNVSPAKYAVVIRPISGARIPAVSSRRLRNVMRNPVPAIRIRIATSKLRTGRIEANT
jgi:hypothetical protein